VSPDIGTPRHNWIAPKKKEKTPTDIRKRVAEMYPHFSNEEVDLMIKLSDKKEINAYLRAHGDTD
jgi:hypothetical protein